MLLLNGVLEVGRSLLGVQVEAILVVHSQERGVASCLKGRRQLRCGATRNFHQVQLGDSPC